MTLAVVLIALAGMFLVFGARKAAASFVVGGVAVAAVATALEADFFSDVSVDNPVLAIGLYAVGFLVAMVVLRYMLALFFGYGTADTVVGGLLAFAIASVLAIFRWPFRIMRRLVRGFGP